jgi:hypothetical protein
MVSCRESLPAVIEVETPMRIALRTLLAVVAGMALAFVLVVLVEWFSSVVHPFPANFDGNIPEHVRRYPDWVLGVVVVLWAAAAASATWLATRIGGRLAGGLVTVLLALALAFNLSMLSYPMWFRAAMGCTFPVSCLLGIVGGNRRLRESKA